MSFVVLLFSPSLTPVLVSFLWTKGFWWLSYLEKLGKDQTSWFSLPYAWLNWVEKPVDVACLLRVLGSTEAEHWWVLLRWPSLGKFSVEMHQSFIVFCLVALFWSAPPDAFLLPEVPLEWKSLLGFLHLIPAPLIPSSSHPSLVYSTHRTYVLVLPAMNLEGSKFDAANISPSLHNGRWPSIRIGVCICT